MTIWGPYHDPPWGNWGVQSNGGLVTNGHQFSGWKPKGNQQLHWNSCTTERPNRFPQTSAYFNDPPGGWTKQKATPDNTRLHGSLIWGLADPFNPDATCADLHPGVYTFNPYMKLFELDWPDDDDHVATLRYPSVDLPITCSGSQCSGQHQGWLDPTSGDQDVTAKIKIMITMAGN